MHNAKKFDERLTIGVVPTFEDLRQLKELKYRTIVDLRDETERFGGQVARASGELGLQYVSIPISRDAIELEDVGRFYRAVFARNSAPIYAFSRFGKKPLAFLLLLEAVARGERVPTVFRRASRFGMDLNGDLCLQDFLVNVLNGADLDPVYEALRELRPDLLEPRAPRATPSVPERPDPAIGAALSAASEAWSRKGDRAALRASLERIVDQLR